MSDTMTDSQATLDQRRANHALERIKAVLRLDGDARDDYAREAKKLPVRVMASGLGQALAFIGAKAAKRHSLKQLHGDLTDWVIGGRLASHAKDPNSLLESVIQGDADFLHWATDETLAYLVWLNRFAEANGLPKRDSE